MEESKVLSEYRSQAEKTQIVIIAGGMGKRLGVDIPKALVKIGDKTLLDRCVCFFTNCGFSDFVFLLGKGYEEISTHLGDGSKYGIKIRISRDPSESYVGKGKSLKNAIENGSIISSKRSIVAFPDDIYLDDSLPVRVLLDHLHAVKEHGVNGSIVLSRGREWPFGVAELNEKGLVEKFQEKPFVSMFTSVGMYLLEPSVYELAKNLIDLQESRAIEFEQVLLPKLADDGKLNSIIVSPDTWIPINTQKEFEYAKKVISP